MKRRDLLIGMGAFAMSRVRGRAAAPVDIQLEVDVTRGMGNIPADFTGLGYEISSVARKGLLDPSNTKYIQLVKTLSKNGVIRIGGNTSDFSAWEPHGEASILPKATVTNTALVEALGGFLRATGWKLIWGLNLGRGTAESAADQAAAVARAAGDRLLCFEIGNEPDLFVGQGHKPKGYGYAEYRQEFERFAEALRARVPGARLAGPDVAGATDWVASFAHDERDRISLLTEHYYRTGQKNPLATMENLLNTDERFVKMTARLQEIGKSSGLPYRLCELNSFSGGGKPRISDTFASALWGLDLMFTLASAGGAGINFETGLNHLGFVSSYSPIYEDEAGNLTARPLYYGMLAFATAGTGRLVEARSSASGGNFRSYATVDTSGRLCFTLINKDVATAVNASIKVPAPASSVEVLRLSAPAINSMTGVTFGGTEVSANGIWAPRRQPVVRVRGGMLNLGVPVASASIVRVT